LRRTDKQRNVSGISPTREEGPPKAQDQTTYVLVHGAWHGSWCWKRVRKSLRDAGHQVFTPTLTGLGERSHLNSAAVNLSTHTADVVNLLRWEDISDVVLCGHSYGGSVISGVADRIGIRDVRGAAIAHRLIDSEEGAGAPFDANESTRNCERKL
jgi:pimeloyl-ACP methyl ester carboxylesterase